MWRIAESWCGGGAVAGAALPQVGAGAEVAARAGDHDGTVGRSSTAIERNSASSSFHIAASAAFFFSGRRSVIVTTPSVRSTVIGFELASVGGHVGRRY